MILGSEFVFRLLLCKGDCVGLDGGSATFDRGTSVIAVLTYTSISLDLYRNFSIEQDTCSENCVILW
jgi:hypothetical protein